jgi:hypothetical protein
MKVRGMFVCIAPAVLFVALTACAPKAPVQAKDGENESKQSTGIQIKSAPAPVEKTVLEQSAGATLVGFTTEKKKNEILYEAEMKVNGHAKNP